MGATHMKKKERPARGHGAAKYLPLYGKKVITAKVAKEMREKSKDKAKPHDVLTAEYGLDPMLVFKIVHGVTVKVFGEKKHVK